MLAYDTTTSYLHYAMVLGAGGLNVDLSENLLVGPPGLPGAPYRVQLGPKEGLAWGQYPTGSVWIVEGLVITGRTAEQLTANLCKFWKMLGDM